MIRRAIENGGLEEINAIQAAIQSTGALAYTVAKARECANKAQLALERVPDSIFRTALIDLAEFAVERRY